MSQLYEIVPHIIIGAVMMPAILVAIRWTFGPGLAFKIFMLLMPLFFVVSMSSIWISRLTIGSAAHVVSLLFLLCVVVGGLTYLYRSIVSPLLRLSQSLSTASRKLVNTRWS